MINDDNNSLTTTKATISLPNGTSVKHTNEDHQEQLVQNDSTTDRVISTDEETTQVVALRPNKDEETSQVVALRPIENEDTTQVVAIRPNENEETQIVAMSPNDEDEQPEEEVDEFIRITAAHQMLTEAQTFDEQKNYPSALHLYRICVDLLLEELMFTEGTDQSRIYLREKCTAIMDRIDVLKTMLAPIPPPTTTTTTTTETTTTEAAEPPAAILPPLTEDLQSLSLS